MRIYFAPMEGTTGYLYRNLHHRYFGGVDKYFMPFLSPTKEKTLSKREKREIEPENNRGVPVVPQLLTCKAEDFLWCSEWLFDLGYPEVNLNLGCPSGTVTAKGKGSGFLARPEELERFFDEIFGRVQGPVSVKTRLGFSDPEEFHRLLEIYNRYPISELTIHPRVRSEYYKGTVPLDRFGDALEQSCHPVCYNGDLTTVGEVEIFQARFPEVEQVMIGRGLMADPALARKCCGGGPASRRELQSFHDALYESYCVAFESRQNAMMRMKEYWFYHINLFAEHKKLNKKLKKAADPAEYEKTVGLIFQELELLPHVVAEWKEQGVR